LERYAWIIFTSSYGVTFFLQRMQERGISRHSLSDPKICAVGPATARTLKEFDISVALIPRQFVAEGVLQALEQYHGGLQNLSGRRILLARAKEARDVLPDALRAAGAQVDVVSCYQTVKAELDDTAIRKLKAKMPEIVVFTSSSTVRNLIEILGIDIWETMRKESTVAALGPVTAATVESFGKRASILPKENTVASLIDAIRHWAVESG
jgi:uroporphyrinogen III methyltransferase/synthase